MTINKSKRFFASLLALVMMMVACSVSMFAFAVGEEESPALPPEIEDTIENLDIKSYMHFGDSMSTGYMMNATQDEINNFNVVMTDDGGMAFPSGNPNTTTHNLSFPYTYGCYPSLIAEELGLGEHGGNWVTFAREGLTTNDIHRIMDPNFYNQMDAQAKRNSDKAFATLFGTEAQGKKELANMQAEVAKRLPTVDLVTVGAGPNDLIFSTLFDVLFKLQDATTGNTLYSSIVNNAFNAVMTAMGQYNVAAAYADVLNVADIVGSLPEVMATIGLSVARGYMSVQQNWEALVNTVHAANPNAIIVCVGGYNATRDLQFADIDMVRVGKGMGMFTTIMNLYWANTCPLRSQYYFVDIRNVDLPEWPDMVAWPGLLTGGGFMGYFMYCSHPTPEGHRQIAEAIMNTLYQEDGTNTLPVTSLI